LFFEKTRKNKQKMEKAALEHLDALYGTAMRMTGRVADAEDLVQDTYLRALRFRDKFEPGSNLKAWLFKMMVNLFINKYRRHKRTRELREGIERHDLLQRQFTQEKLAATEGPEEHFFERLFSDDVVNALGELPHDFKMVVLMVDINDFSYAEVADILGIPVGTVMSRLHRGRRLLRANLHSFAVREGYIKEKKEDNEPADLEEFRQRRG